MITIYSSDGATICKVPITRDAVHEEELMVSNFVKLSWKAKNSRILPAGSYIIPYEDELGSDGKPLKYFLFENYSPTSEKENRFTFEPQFQHPVMWLSKIPFIHLTGDTTSWDTATKNYEWTYTGPPATIVEEIVTFINTWCGRDDLFASIFGSGWVKVMRGDLPATATCNFTANDVWSGATVVANAFECEFHFNFAARTLYFGNLNSSVDSVPELKTGKNVGVANISRTKKEYYNRYVVLGGTKNMTQQTASGDNIQLTTRLTLNPDYKDSIIDLRAPNSKEPMMTGELVFDDIYPKLELNIYNPRERLCWLLDENKEKVEDPDGLLDPVTEKRYKYYSKWYIRLAYHTTEQLTGKTALSTETVEGVTYYWYEFEMSDELLVADRPLSILFQTNYNSPYSSALAGREFEIVWYQETPSEREKGEDDVDPYGFQPTAGDYRIEFDDSSGTVIPTTDKNGLCPRGDEKPSWKNNKVTLVNVALDSSYKETAQSELFVAAQRKIDFLRSDLNNYTFNSNPLAFRLDNPNLFIGQKVIYNDGQDLNGSTSYTLISHVRKLVTRLDDPNKQEISVGNEKVKGNISSMKDQIENIISGGFGGDGSALTENQFMTLLRNYGSKLFLSKVKADSAQEKITFLKGVDFGASGAWGYVKEIITDGVAEIVAWFKNLKADVLQVLDYIKGPLDIKGGDVTISKDEGGNGGDLHVEGDVDAENLTVRDSITTNNLTVTGLAHFFELVIDKLRASGGAQIYTCADGFVVQDVVTSGSFVYLYWRATDGERKIKNMWEKGDQAICMNFNEVTEAGSYSNVSNKFYWSVVADKGTEVHRFSLGDGEYEDVDAHFIKIYTGADVTLNQNTINRNYVGSPQSADIGDEIAMLGSRATTVDAAQRKVAVYLSAYSSLDTGNASRSGLTAPLLAFYKGLNNFDLTSHRTTYIDANGSEFRGNFFITSSNGDIDINSLFSGSEIDIIYGYGNPNTVSKPHENWSDAEKLAKVDKVLYFDLDEEPASEGGRLYKWLYQQANAETGTAAGYLWVSVTDIDTTAALDHIRDVASDGKLSGGAEKLRVFLDWTDAKKTCTSLMAQATEDDRNINTDNINTYDGVHTYKSAYDGIVTSFNDLSTYLNDRTLFTLTSEGYPAWIDPNNLLVGIKVTIELPSWTEKDASYTNGALTYRTLWQNFYAAAVELTRAINAYQFQKIDEMGDDGLLDPAEKTALREIFANEVKHYFEMMDEAASYGVDENGDFTGEYVDEYGNTRTILDFVGDELSHLGSFLDGVLESYIRPATGDTNERPDTMPPDTWIVNDNMRDGLTEEEKPSSTSSSPKPEERSGYPKWLLRENETKEEVINDVVWDSYWRYYRDARATMEDVLLRARKKNQEDSKPTIFVTNTPTNPSMPSPPPYKVNDVWYEQVYLTNPVTGEKKQLDENNNPLYNEYVCEHAYSGNVLPSYSDKASYWRLVKGASLAEFVVDSKKGEIIQAVYSSSQWATIVQNLDGITQTVAKLGASRNMLLNGDFSAVSSGSALANFSKSKTTGVELSRSTSNVYTGFDYSAYLNITTASMGNGIQMTTSDQPCLLLKSGKSYTLSLYAITTSTSSNLVLSVFRNNTLQGDMTDIEGAAQTVGASYKRFRYILNGDGYARALIIAPRTTSGGNASGKFYFCGIQLEEGTEVTEWMAGERNADVLESQIKQTAEEISLTVKKGEQVGGIKIENSGVTLIGSKTKIEGDLDIKGLTINSAQKIKYDSNYVVNDTLVVPINLTTVKSVVVKGQNDDPNGVINTRPIVFLPQTSATTVNGQFTLPAVTQSGVTLNITNAMNLFKRNWTQVIPYSGNQPTVKEKWNSSLIICADARLLSTSNYANGTPIISPIVQPSENGLEGLKNTIFCNGNFGKFLALMPGQTVTLVSSLEEYGNSTYLAWYVVNGTEFTAVQCKLYIEAYTGTYDTGTYSYGNGFGFQDNDYYEPMRFFGHPALNASVNDTMVKLAIYSNDYPYREVISTT